MPRFQRALLKNVSRTHGKNEKATVGTQRITARKEKEKDTKEAKERQTASEGGDVRDKK